MKIFVLHDGRPESVSLVACVHAMRLQMSERADRALGKQLHVRSVELNNPALGKLGVTKLPAVAVRAPGQDLAVFEGEQALEWLRFFFRELRKQKRRPSVPPPQTAVTALTPLAAFSPPQISPQTPQPVPAAKAGVQALAMQMEKEREQEQKELATN